MDYRTFWELMFSLVDIDSITFLFFNFDTAIFAVRGEKMLCSQFTKNNFWKKCPNTQMTIWLQTCTTIQGNKNRTKIRAKYKCKSSSETTLRNNETRKKCIYSNWTLLDAMLTVRWWILCMLYVLSLQTYPNHQMKTEKLKTILADWMIRFDYGFEISNILLIYCVCARVGGRQ